MRSALQAFCPLERYESPDRASAFTSVPATTEGPRGIAYDARYPAPLQVVDFHCQPLFKNDCTSSSSWADGTPGWALVGPQEMSIYDRRGCSRPDIGPPS